VRGTQHIASTAHYDTNRISNNNQGFFYRPVEGQPDCDVFTMDILVVSPRCVSVTLPNSIQLGNLVASQWPTQLGH